MPSYFTMRQRRYIIREVKHFSMMIGTEHKQKVRLEMSKDFIEKHMLPAIPNSYIVSYGIHEVIINQTYPDGDSINISFKTPIELLDHARLSYIEKIPADMYENGILNHNCAYISGVYDFINNVFTADADGGQVMNFIIWGEHINAFYVNRPTWFHKTIFNKEYPHQSKEVIITDGLYSPGDITTQVYSTPIHPNDTKDYRNMDEDEYEKKYKKGGYGWLR